MCIRQIVSNRLRNGQFPMNMMAQILINSLLVMIFENFKFEPNHYEIQRNLTGPEGGWMTGLKT